MNEQAADRIAKAQESIAESLAKLANPPLMMTPGGEVVALRGAPYLDTSLWPFARDPKYAVETADMPDAAGVRIIPVEGKVS